MKQETKDQVREKESKMVWERPHVRRRTAGQTQGKMFTTPVEANEFSAPS